MFLSTRRYCVQYTTWHTVKITSSEDFIFIQWIKPGISRPKILINLCLCLCLSVSLSLSVLWFLRQYSNFPEGPTYPPRILSSKQDATCILDLYFFWLLLQIWSLSISVFPIWRFLLRNKAISTLSHATRGHMQDPLYFICSDLYSISYPFREQLKDLSVFSIVYKLFLSERFWTSDQKSRPQWKPKSSFFLLP